MASGPPPLPPFSTPTSLPVPHPVVYRSARINDMHWVTVATLRSCSQWHAARARLTQNRIESRVGKSTDDTEEIDLQVPATEAEWVTEILQKAMPELARLAIPLGGFATGVSPAATGTGMSPAPRTPLPVIPLVLASLKQPASVNYLILTVLWLLLIGIVVSMIVVCL